MLAFVLSVCMVLTTFPLTAFAGGSSEVADATANAVQEQNADDSSQAETTEERVILSNESEEQTVDAAEVLPAENQGEDAVDLMDASEGICGDDLTWKLDDDGNLSINGTGAMKDYDWESAPWYRFESEITTLTIAEGITSIGDNAFCGMESLNRVTIPDSVKLIGVNAFNSCYSLQNVEMGTGVTGIGWDAFKDCDAMTSIIIPGGVTDIEGETFYSCDNLKTVTICNGVVAIGSRAFQRCDNLETITIPASMKSVSISAFGDVPLQSVYYGGTMAQWNQILVANDNDNLINSASIRDNSVVPTTKDTGIPAAELSSGICGSDLSWTLDNEGLLVISGSGAMRNYEWGSAPWSSYVNYIKNVRIDAGVTSIGEHAFSGMDCIATVTIPDSVKLIGYDAFRKCYNLQIVTMGNGLTGIGDCAFSECDALTSIIIPGGVTGIQLQTFYSCDSLKKVTLCEGVSVIGIEAFQWCDSLNTVTIPDSIESISRNAFEGESLQDVYYGGTKTQWNQILVADGNNDLLNTATIRYGSEIPATPDTGIPAEEVARGTCGSDLSWNLDNEGLLVISGNGLMNDYEQGTAPWSQYGHSIKNVRLAQGVTSVGNHAFAGLDGLISVTISDSVKLFGYAAFRECRNLQIVDTGNGLTGIGDCTFSECDALTSIVIPGGVTGVPIDSFYSCDSLLSVTLCEGVSAVGVRAFQWCDNLKTVKMPSSMSGIANAAFEGTPLEDVYYGGARTQWNQIIISGNNDSLTNTATIRYSSVIPTTKDTGIAAKQITHGTCGSDLSWTLDDEGLLVISGSGAMKDYEWGNTPWSRYVDIVKKIQINTGVTSVGACAFSHMYGVISVTIPDSVTLLGDSAFEECWNLQIVNMGSGVTGIGSWAFKNCDGLTSIVIPEGVTGIQEQTFYDCESLKTVTIGEGVSSIGSEAFAWCGNLKTVTIPASMISIADSAFCDTSLDDVYYAGTLAQWNQIEINDGNDALYSASIHYQSDTSVAVTDILLNKSTLSLNVGDSATLTANVAPVNATNKKVNWSSSDKKVANVSDGTVTAVGIGEAKITVTTVDGNKTASCTVKVLPVPVTGVSLNQSTMSLKVGDTGALTAKVEPSNATNKAVSWTSSNTSVATVSNGTVTAKSVGETTVTVTTADGNQQAACTVTVLPVSVTGVTLNQSAISLKVGETGTLTATMLPSNATNKNVSWSSSNPSVAEVSNGMITAKDEGTATITVTTADGNKKATCLVTVIPISDVPLKLLSSYSRETKTATLRLMTTEEITLANYDIQLGWDQSVFTLAGTSNGQSEKFSSFVSNLNSAQENYGKISAMTGGNNVTIGKNQTLVTYTMTSEKALSPGEEFEFTVTVRDAADQDASSLTWKGGKVSDKLVIFKLSSDGFDNRTAGKAVINCDNPAAGDFTVACANPCIVVYNNGSAWNSISAAAVTGQTNLYSFGLPADWDENTKIVVCMKGDFTGDGDISSTDALQVLRASVGSRAFDAVDILVSDFNGDGSLTSTDALQILRLSVGIRMVAW